MTKPDGRNDIGLGLQTQTDRKRAEQSEALDCRCDCCFRRLTAQASIDSGRGPVCRQRAGITA